jgi:hypothetical protein
MSGLSAVSDTAGKFTDEMLARNFVSIANGFDDFEKYLGHLEGHVSELSKSVQTLVAKAPRVSKVKPFLVGAAVGVVAYKYFTKNRHKIEEYAETVKEEVKERFDSSPDSAEVRFSSGNSSGTIKSPGV